MKRKIVKHAWIFMAAAILIMAAIESEHQSRRKNAPANALINSRVIDEDLEVRELNIINVLMLLREYREDLCDDGIGLDGREDALSAESLAHLTSSGFILGAEVTGVMIDGDWAIARGAGAASRAIAWIDDEEPAINDFIVVLRREPSGCWCVVDLRSIRIT